MSEYPINAIDKLGEWLKKPIIIELSTEVERIPYEAIGSVAEFVTKEAVITDSGMLSGLILRIQKVVEDFEKGLMSELALKQQCHMIGIWVNQKSIMFMLRKST